MGNTLCPSGDDAARTVKHHEAATLDADGNVQLSASHQEYLDNSAKKTAQKSEAIKAAYEAVKGDESAKGKAAVSRYWFEFSHQVSERLAHFRNEENARMKMGKKKEEPAAEEKGDKKEEDKKEGDKKEEGDKKADAEKEAEKKAEKEAEKAAAKDPKEVHKKFIKEMNRDLEQAIEQVWRAYTTENDDGDEQFLKEASLQFFDDLVRGANDMCVPSLEMYSRYTMKYSASQDEEIQKKKTEAVDKAVSEAVAAVKAKLKEKAEAALKSEAEAKNPNAASLERAIAAAKKCEGVDSADAEKKLEEAKAKIAEKEEAAKKKDEDKAAKEKAKCGDDADKLAKYEKKVEEENKKKEEAEGKKKEAQDELDKAVADAGDDVDKIKEAVAEAKKNAAKPDTTAAENKAEDVAEAKKNADEEENEKIKAKASAEAKWRVTVDQEIDALIHEWAENYTNSFCIQQAAGFAKFFDGKNGAGEDFEMKKEDLTKTLSVGEEGGFEAFAQELGFKVVPADAVAAVKERIDKVMAEEDKAAEKDKAAES